MINEKAERYFHGEEGYNCAQAVLMIFQDRLDVSQALISEHHDFGGGRVEGGICGALHAARCLVPDALQTPDLDQRFQLDAGSLVCKKIRKLKQLSCLDCVKAAARALDNLLPGG